ncbi:MAG: hypothetical protein ATN35_12330 [Epulopiscium sp. Nele67-Bin004]|nr:MAG: hypothetical protein ATN35_12330 [Epulopiscium sp. Nele67-Bin004]
MHRTTSNYQDILLSPEEKATVHNDAIAHEIEQNKAIAEYCTPDSIITSEPKITGQAMPVVFP